MGKGSNTKRELRRVVKTIKRKRILSLASKRSFPSRENENTQELQEATPVAVVEAPVADAVEEVKETAAPVAEEQNEPATEDSAEEAIVETPTTEAAVDTSEEGAGENEGSEEEKA